MKDLSGNMGRSEGDEVEVAVDRMYREEIPFGSIIIGESQKPENNYKVGMKLG